MFNIGCENRFRVMESNSTGVLWFGDGNQDECFEFELGSSNIDYSFVSIDQKFIWDTNISNGALSTLFQKKQNKTSAHKRNLSAKHHCWQQWWWSCWHGKKFKWCGIINVDKEKLGLLKVKWHNKELTGLLLQILQIGLLNLQNLRCSLIKQEK